MSRFTPYVHSVARFIFGFLILRHGMEQVFGYPEASDSALRSYQGVVELIAAPSAILIMLGLFTSPVSGLLSALYAVAFVAAPLQKSFYTHRNGGDPIPDPAECVFLSLPGRRRRRGVESGSTSRSARPGIARLSAGAVRARHVAHRGGSPVCHARPGEILQRGGRPH